MPILTRLSGPSRAEVRFNQLDSALEFEFEILTKEALNLCPYTGKSIWGLWDYDVVEIFLQERKNPNEVNAPYYEFQLSPGNKQFFLKIIRPREIYYSPLHLAWLGKTETTNQGWKAQFNLSQLPITCNKHLYMGVFAILGKNDKSYFSYKPNDDILDYHRPQHFSKLTIF